MALLRLRSAPMRGPGLTATGPLLFRSHGEHELVQADELVAPLLDVADDRGQGVGVQRGVIRGVDLDLQDHDLGGLEATEYPGEHRGHRLAPRGPQVALGAHRPEDAAVAEGIHDLDGAGVEVTKWGSKPGPGVAPRHRLDDLGSLQDLLAS